MKDLTQMKQLSVDACKKTRWCVYPNNQRSRGEEWHETSY